MWFYQVFYDEFIILELEYSGDLNSRHSVNGTIWLTDFTIAGSLPDQVLDKFQTSFWFI